MRSLRILLRLGPWILTGLALLFAPAEVRAAWPPLGGPGVTVCDAPGDPGQAESAPDGLGGAFLAWIDARAGHPESRVFAQHLDAAGTPLWTEDGMLINASRASELPRLVADGVGGVIIVWRDFRADTAGNVYAQRLNGAGARLWSSSDVTVAAGPLHEASLAAAADGSGGAFVAWSDDRTGTADVRVQRLTASGALDWGTDGVALEVPASLVNPVHSLVRSDGSGGALVGYSEVVSGRFSAFVQRVSPTGDLLWTAGGVNASSSTLGLDLADLDADGMGGALVAIRDYRSQNTWAQAFAQRISADGIVAWAADGVPLSGTIHPVQEQSVVADGAGGGFFAWRSYLNDGSGASHLKVQHLSAAGAAQWDAATQVVAVPVDGGFWLRSRMVADDAGGVVLGWNAEGTSGGYDVSAQRLAGDGTRLWSGGPRVLASLPNVVNGLALTPDGTGGVVASWRDSQGFSGASTLAAQRVMGTGTLDAPYGPSVTRGVRCSPTPARAGDAIAIRFVVAQAGPTRVRVLDVSGRLVRAWSPRSSTPGEQALVWDVRDAQGSRVRPGLYLVRVEGPGMELTGRVVVIE